jgi:hypothetical protein
VNLEYAFLADAAETVNGKLYVMGGGITILWRNQFPAPLDVSLVVAFHYNAAEAGGQRELKLEVNDADGKNILPPLQAQFAPAGRAPGVPSGVSLGALFAIGIGGAPILPGPGDYAIEILLDGNHVKSVPFAVAIPQPS